MPSSPQTHRHPVDDDEFDVKPYLLLVWRRRYLIVLLTMLCGAINTIFNWSQPAVHEATGRIYVGEPGSTGHAETVGRLRLLAADPAVLADVVKTPPLGSGSNVLSVPELQSAITLRSGSPANVLLVGVRLNDANAASQAAKALANRMVAGFRSQAVLTAEATQVVLAKADEDLSKARQAALDYVLSKQLRQRRDARSLAMRNREELSDTLTMIVTERARLKAALRHTEVPTSIQIALAGLEARRDYLAAAIAANEKAEGMRVLALDELEYQRLETELSVAIGRRNEFARTLSEVHAKAENPAEPPTILDVSAPDSRDVSPTPTENLGWALAFGLLASMAVVMVLEKWPRQVVRGARTSV